MTKLLIVDDNEQNLYMLRVLLEEGYGYEVVSAGDGAEALEVARRDPPDVIIADVLMPVMDGFALCRQWKKDEVLKAIPFVFYTATYTDPKDEELALSLGAERFIVKPVEPDVFVEMLREVIEEREAGRLVAPRELVEEEAVYYREYNEVLIRKLEDKMLQLEEANRALECDIAERKRAEEALQEYSERLEEMVDERTKELREAQEKLVTLGQLAGGVAHELRNPLGAIKNVSYFLHMVLEEPETEVREMLQILGQEVDNCDHIISSLLDLARPRLPTLCKVDLNDVVQDALSRTAVPKKVKVVRQLNESLPVILADPDQLGQAFGNIILNAIQAMTSSSSVETPDGGRLVIKSEALGPEWVAVSFTDTGVGIPEENLDKIFEPLFTTKAKGIGLGLPLAKMLVERHGGSIEVQSEVAKGSTFTVKLPTGGGEAK